MSSSTYDTASDTTSTFPTRKRLSLNLSSATGGCPRPLHLLDSSAIASSPSAHSQRAFSPSPHFTPSSPSSGTAGPVTPLSAKRFSEGSVRVGSARRQSSIAYISSSDYDTPLKSPLIRSSSIGHDCSQALSKKNGPGDRRSTGSIHTVSRSATTDGRPSPKDGPPAPLTMVERHAELLHFIAQKESKCLELRSQLATHEAELLQLKRKWERIVARGFEKTTGDGALSLSTIPSNSNNPTGGAVLDGIKEGVTRFISANLTEISSSGSSPSHPSPPTQWSGLGHAAQASTTSTTSSTTTASSSGFGGKSIKSRHSLSSVSSLGEPSPTGDEEKEANTSGPDSRDQQPHTVDSACGSARETKAAKTIRRRSRDQSAVYSLADVNGYPQGMSDAANEPLKANKRVSLSLTGLPPPSTIPGLMSMSVGNGWVEGLGKRWEELSKGPESTFSKSQKRASILISDVSQSIYSALASPSLHPGQPPKPSNHLSTTLPPRPTSSTTASESSVSLLDDDDECQQLGGGGIMKPDPLVMPPKPCSKSTAATVMDPKQDEDDEDWNW